MGPFPINDLAGIQFLPHDQFKAANQQLGLAGLYNQNQLDQGQQDLQGKILKNLFDAQQNPQLLKHQGLLNEGLGYKNTVDKINMEHKVKLAPEELKARRAELLSKASEAELKQLMDQAGVEATSDDPAIAARGQRKLMASATELSNRQKHKETMEVHAADNASREKVGAGHDAASLGAARISADARVQSAKGRSQSAQTFEQAVLMGKITPEKAIVYYQSRSRDPKISAEERQEASEEAQRYEAYMMNKPVAGKVGTLDTPAAAGMPAVQAPPSAFGRQDGRRPNQSAGPAPALPNGWKEVK